MAAVTIRSDFGAQENKVSHCFHCFPIYLHEVMGPDAMILVLWMLSFKPTFSPFSYTSSRGFLVPLHFLCADYIMWNDRLDEAQAGINIAGKNINNLRYADDTTLMVRKSEEELKIPLMRVKEENEKVDLKLNINKTKIMVSGPITSWQIEGEEV